MFQLAELKQSYIEDIPDLYVYFGIALVVGMMVLGGLVLLVVKQNRTRVQRKLIRIGLVTFLGGMLFIGLTNPLGGAEFSESPPCCSIFISGIGFMVLGAGLGMKAWGQVGDVLKGR